MDYSKSTPNNLKGIKLAIDTDVCAVRNWSLGEILVGSDEELIKRKKKEQEKKNLLQLQKSLLEQTKHAMSLRNYGYSFVEAGKFKRK